MTESTKVAVVSPTGQTGQSVVKGLLNSTTNFEITALTRKESLEKPVLKSFQKRGVKVVAVDLNGPKEELIEVLAGIDVVISCMYWLNLKDQIPLIEAAKGAGVKRFVPSSFMTAHPPGVMKLADWKAEILEACKRNGLDWTVIDVGWWSQQIVPAIPSGRTDKFVNPHINIIPGNGTVPSAFTYLADVGNYTARIITDPRTLNKKVFAYTDVLTLSQVGDLLKELSGEEPIRQYLLAEDILNAIAGAEEKYKDDNSDMTATITIAINQYLYSWGVRGDNTPEAAERFGYLDFKKLYPGAKGKTLSELFQSILDDTLEP